jgi:hypothetical protein
MSWRADDGVRVALVLLEGIPAGSGGTGGGGGDDDDDDGGGLGLSTAEVMYEKKVSDVWT